MQTELLISPRVRTPAVLAIHKNLICTTFRGEKCIINQKTKHTTNEKEKPKPLGITELFSNSKGFSDGGA